MTLWLVEEGWDLRLRWVRAQVYAVEAEDVVFRVLTVLERVLAGDVEFLVEGSDGRGAAEEAGAQAQGRR